MRTGFDHDLYTRMQSEHIRSRIAVFGGKLYLELGGKLFDDFHASRVLPGFKPDSKVSMLLNLKDQAELVVAINADGNPFTAHFDAGCGMAVDMITGAPHDFGGGSELAPYSVSYWKMER